jgi:WD40 repeat protein
MKAVPGQLRGRRLLHKIRFPQMDEECLADVAENFPPDHMDWIEGLVAEAVRARAALQAGAPFEARLLDPRALARRVGEGVKWEEYLDGGEERLRGHGVGVSALAECDGRICSGSDGGSIRIWNKATLKHERTLSILGPVDGDQVADEGDERIIRSLVVWNGRLISGDSSGNLRAWNVLTGECERVLYCHLGTINALAVCGERLVSGSADRLVKVWAAERADAPWACEHELRAHDGFVLVLAAWGSKVISGSDDRRILVWDAPTGGVDAQLVEHAGKVNALVVHRDQLLSASDDGTIRTWAVGTWAPLRTVDTWGAGEGSPQHLPMCMAVCGSRIVSGSWGRPYDHKLAVRVWDLHTLEHLHTLHLRKGDWVNELLAVDGEVWAAVGRDVVVWGRS